MILFSIRWIIGLSEPVFTLPRFSEGGSVGISLRDIILIGGVIAAVAIAIIVVMVAAEPIAHFVSAHPSTKMLALAFLVMVGRALVADGFQHHVEHGFIYAAMVFAGAVEGLNLWRQERGRAAKAQ